MATTTTHPPSFALRFNSIPFEAIGRFLALQGHLRFPTLGAAVAAARDVGVGAAIEDRRGAVIGAWSPAHGLSLTLGA